MRIAVLLLLNVLAQHVSANDLLWQKLRTEADLVELMRHTQPAGGNPLTWDESGGCKGESMLTVEGKAHVRKIGEAFAKHGIKPSVISSPMCRCRDTARIAFGDALVTDAALREIATADRERISAFERKASGRRRMPPNPAFLRGGSHAAAHCSRDSTGVLAPHGDK